MKIFIGDITKTQSDCVVNAADTDFTAGGGVARWIKKQGGDDIFKEATKFAPGEVGKSYISNAGKLDSKYVIHIPTIDWSTNTRIGIEQIHQSTVIAMDTAIKNSCKSIVFPLLGAGTVGLDEKDVAYEIADAITHMEQDFSDFEGGLDVLNEQVFEKIKNALTDFKYEIIKLK